MSKDEVRLVSIELPVKLWAALSFWATYEGRTKKEIIIEALRTYLEVHGIEQHGIKLDD